MKSQNLNESALQMGFAPAVRRVQPGAATHGTVMVKILELVLCMAYIIYDVATTEPLVVGTTESAQHFRAWPRSC